MQKPQYRLSGDTSRGPSPNIWADCPWMEMLHDPTIGWGFFDDFFQAGEGTDTAQTWPGPQGLLYLCHGTAGTTVLPKTGVAGALTGIMELDVDNNDEEVYLSFSTTYCPTFGEISSTAANARKLWFEGRVRFDTVLSGSPALGKFFGLGASGMNVANAMAADAASVVVKDFVGFRAVAADGDGMDAVHIKVSGAEVVVCESAAGPTAQTLTADTWVKLGIHFDGTNTWWYVNGEKVVGTGVLADATNFPDGKGLHPIFGIRHHSAGTEDYEADIDWWRFARLF